MRILAKVGGKALLDASSRARFAHSVALTREAGHEVVLVHGGGAQIKSLAGRLGLPEEKRAGLRVTDKATAEVVQAVLGGTVGRDLVRSLGERDVPAVSITGVDGGSFGARPIDAADFAVGDLDETGDAPDLGYVGKIRTVEPRLIEVLLSGGFVPVIAPLAALAREVEARDESDECLYNINADDAVAPLAGALRADAVLFLSDVDGVKGAEGELVSVLSHELCAELTRKGVIASGMLPKTRAAFDVFDAEAQPLVKAASWDQPSALLRALTPETGTRFLAESHLHG